MATATRCPYCKEPVHPEATVCPHCTRSFPERWPWQWWLALAILVVLASWWLFAFLLEH